MDQAHNTLVQTVHFVPNVDSRTKLLTAKAIIGDMTCHIAFSPWPTPGRSSEFCRAGEEELFAQQRTSTPDRGREPDETERGERSQRTVITEEDFGLTCKLEMGKLDRLWGELDRSCWQAALQGQREVSMGKSGMVGKRQEGSY